MQVLETCLYAPDLEAARAFYQGVLGLELFAEKPGRHIFFRAGPGVFLIFNPAETEQDTELPPHGARGCVHVCFKVEAQELEGWAQRLEVAQYPVTWVQWQKS
jgi:catechol 2,3-dioxygenase-like lactoylglutathione lyase family enzyme